MLNRISLRSRNLPVHQEVLSQYQSQECLRQLLYFYNVAKVSNPFTVITRGRNFM